MQEINVKEILSKASDEIIKEIEEDLAIVKGYYTKEILKDAILRIKRIAEQTINEKENG